MAKTQWEDGTVNQSLTNDWVIRENQHLSKDTTTVDECNESNLNGRKDNRIAIKVLICEITLVIEKKKKTRVDSN